MFVISGSNNWYQNVRGFLATKPGVLYFDLYDTKGKLLLSAKRYITYGNNSGKHKFLFEIPSQPWKTKAVGPE
jgi:hypothetical protein